MATPSATHERLVSDGEIRTSSNRTFGFVMAVFLAIVGTVRFLAGHSVRWYLGAAIVLLLVSVTRPDLLAPLNRAWTWLGMTLHRCLSPVVLALIFYTTLTPIAILLRLAGKDVLRLRLDRDGTTYWIERRPPGPPPETMRHQF
jgi:hypothetical protein